jgi:hypothetical protein
MKKLVIYSLFISWVFISGKPIQSIAYEGVVLYKIEGNIPYSEAKNYFVNNTFTSEQITNHYITNQSDFEVIFGMGRTMGENGKPTEIDFSKQFVIAVVGKVTDKATLFSVASFKNKGKNIILRYKIIEGEKLTYQSQPFIILVVDSKYKGELIVEKI